MYIIFGLHVQHGDPSIIYGYPAFLLNKYKKKMLFGNVNKITPRYLNQYIIMADFTKLEILMALARVNVVFIFYGNDSAF